MTAGGMVMEIFWFGNDSGGRSERAAVEEWVGAHGEDIREIHHLVCENEMEAIKVISGEQGEDAAGGVSIKAIELHFFRNLLLIAKTEEQQDPLSYLVHKTVTQLGYIEMPCGHDHAEGCQKAGHKRK